VRPLLWLRPGRAIRHALGLVWLMGLSAWAGGLSVLPTRLDLGANKGLQSVLITNISAQAVTVETQVLVWPEGAAGQQANDIVVTPAVLTLPPNQRMRVRVGLLRPAGGDVERAYRL
jgi:P pilus assembly chaperone PapD